MASTTAELMALFRALETVRRPRAARLFEDPWAREFLRPSLRAVVAAARAPGVHGAVCWIIDTGWPGARTAGVARTRFIDDALGEALAAGARQVLILGAGFDARALRIRALAGVPVFEVDLPETSRAKRERLLRRGPLPANVRYVEADLAREPLADVLAAAGFDSAAPSFAVWEGVTNYLTAEAVDATLRALAKRCAPGSRILFTYMDRAVLDGTRSFEGTAQVARLLRRVREPWRFGLDPAALPAYLDERGLTLVRDAGADEMRARLLGPSPRHLRGYGFYHAALAEVRGS